MVSDEEIRGLKAAYEVWQSVEILFEYGPLRAYAPAHQGTIQSLWRDTVDSAVSVVAQTEVRNANGTYATQAPSPWHAYFYLRAQHSTYIEQADRSELRFRKRAKQVANTFSFAVNVVQAGTSFQVCNGRMLPRAEWRSVQPWLSQSIFELSLLLMTT